jgi:hypothetical protein
MFKNSSFGLLRLRHLQSPPIRHSTVTIRQNRIHNLAGSQSCHNFYEVIEKEYTEQNRGTYLQYFFILESSSLASDLPSTDPCCMEEAQI